MPMTMNGGDFAALQQDFERMAQVAEPAQIQSTLEEAAQPITLTFDDAGNYTLAIDQASVEAFAEDIVDELMNGLHSYMEVALAAQLGGQTLDEYLAANNMDFAQLMAASGLNAETLAQQMSSSFENAGNEGKYAFEDGLLSLDGDHHPYELSADSLTIEIPEDVTYELVEVLFPMELERIG